MAQISWSWLAWCGCAAGASFVLTGWVREYALTRGMVDRPGPRSSHQVTTPRGGGLALSAVVVVGCAVLGWLGDARLLGVAGGVIAVAALGWWDDHRSLSPAFRFVLQALVSAAVMVWLGGLGESVLGAAPLNSQWPWFMLTLLAMLWLLNLFNFMDGTDGLAGLQAIAALIVMAVLFARAGANAVGLVCALAAAAVAGFLPHNLPLPRAQIFMGDVGSGALGFLLASLCLLGTHHGIAVQTSFIVLSLFIVDATATLLLRLVRGERWYNAHRQHAYQRLVRGGWSHGRVLLLFVLLYVGLVLPTLLLAQRWPERDWQLAIVLGAVILIGWAIVQYRYRNEAPAQQPGS